MFRFKSLCAALLVSVSAGFAIVPEAKAVENCQYGIYDPAPSEATRWVVGDGYRFKVPDNYKAELLNDGRIAVIDPDTVQFLACVRRNSIGTGNFNYMTVSKTNVRVSEGNWPYNVPGFNGFGQISDILYGRALESDATFSRVNPDSFAQFHYWSDYENRYIGNTFFDLGSGGSVHVQTVFYDVDAIDVHHTATTSLESYSR